MDPQFYGHNRKLWVGDLKLKSAESLDLTRLVVGMKESFKMGLLYCIHGCLLIADWISTTNKMAGYIRTKIVYQDPLGRINT